MPRRALVTLAVLVLGASCSKAAPPTPPTDSGPETTGDELIVPVETADDDALAELAGWKALPVFRGGGRYVQQSSADRGKGGDGGIRMLGNGNRDLNNFVCAGEGAELGKGLVPHVFDMPSCPEAWVKGAVLSRFEGSGRMTRLWITALSLRGGLPDDELLRVYVDDEKTPIVQVPLSKALDGSAGELFAPPFGSGSHWNLAWHYPVVFGKRLVISLDRLGVLDTYYSQTDVVLDDKPRDRKAAAARLPRRDDAKKALTTPVDAPDALLPSAAITLMQDKPVTVADLTGPATIHALRLETSAVAPLDRIDLAVTWDDDPLPAIALPLGELFAASLSPDLGKGRVLEAEAKGGTTTFTLRLPMPFAKRALVQLLSHLPPADVPTLKLALDGERAVPAGGFGRLRVERHDTKGPVTTPYHPIAKVDGGPGRYVGTCAMLEGHSMSGSDLLVGPLNFLEGDERGTIDGTLALPGTGTEDYFDSAFYFDEGARAHPFAQWWGVAPTGTGTPPGARASTCRFHVGNDAIEFRTSFALDLEIGPGDPSLLDRYRTVGFYYR